MEQPVTKLTLAILVGMLLLEEEEKRSRARGRESQGK